MENPGHFSVEINSESVLARLEVQAEHAKAVLGPLQETVHQLAMALTSEGYLSGQQIKTILLDVSPGKQPNMTKHLPTPPATPDDLPGKHSAVGGSINLLQTEFPAA